MITATTIELPIRPAMKTQGGIGVPRPRFSRPPSRAITSDITRRLHRRGDHREDDDRRHVVDGRLDATADAHRLAAEGEREDHEEDDREHHREEDRGGVAPEGLLVVAKLMQEKAHSSLGELQVDVLQSGPAHLEPLEVLAALKRPAGQLVERLDRGRWSAIEISSPLRR